MLGKYLQNKKFVVGFFLLVIIVGISLLAPVITHYGYADTYVGPALKAPSAAHPFGTDRLGRDVYTRVIYGTRISLISAITITSFCLIIGVTLGLLAGYYGGVLDIIIMRIVDLFFTFPWVLMGLLVVVIRGPGLWSVIISLTLAYFPSFARITRSLVLGIREQDFVVAAKLTGESDLVVLLKFILPNCFSALIVQSSIIMSFAILGEAALSYLGYGIRPPEPSWGVLLQQATNYLWGNSYLVIIPGIFIVITVLSFNFLGDGLRDLLDPRYKRIYER
jgi:peptide/nickel transport system permease protein